MRDTFSDRVGRILSGSLNALVDAVENAAPETVMQESLREIDKAVDDVRAELGKVAATRQLATLRMSEKNAEHEKLSSNIAIALQDGREDLAKAAIDTQLDIEAQIPVLERTVHDSVEREQELEGFIVALQAKKREMAEELKRFKATKATAAKDGAAGGATAEQSAAAKADRATSAFERVLENQTGLPGGGASRNAAQLAELEELARENRIKERLTALKQQGAAD